MHYRADLLNYRLIINQKISPPKLINTTLIKLSKPDCVQTLMPVNQINEYLNPTVHTGGQHEVGSLGEPADSGDTLGVTLPGVNVRLGEEAPLRGGLALEVHPHILRGT